LEALRKYSQAYRLREAGDEQGALVLLEEAVAIDTAFAAAYRAIGAVVSNLGLSPSRSVAARRKAFQYRDRLTERGRMRMMGSYYTGVTSELNKARAIYEAAVEAYPEFEGAWHNLGNVYQNQRRDELAEAAYMRAYELGYGPSLGSVVHVQVALGKFDEAQATLDVFADRYPGSADYHNQAARLAYAQGDYARTIRFLRELAQAGTPLARARALAHISAVHSVEGKLGEAERYRIESTDLLTQAGAGRDLLIVTASGATIRLMLGQDVDGEVHDVDGALQQFPLDSLDPLERPYFDIALFYALADRVEQAKELLDEWEALVEPDLRRGAERRRRFVQGVIALSENRVAAAIQELRHALDAEPALLVQVVLPLLGRAYEAGDKADSAIVVYEEYLRSTKVRFASAATSMMASAHNPDAAWRADTYVRLGALYEERGNREQAVDNYNRFIDLWKDADPELQPRVDAVKQRLARLVSEPQIGVRD
jgi:tetratricopeptide (TPR) repeat protein